MVLRNVLNNDSTGVSHPAEIIHSRHRLGACKFESCRLPMIYENRSTDSDVQPGLETQSSMSEIAGVGMLGLWPRSCNSIRFSIINNGRFKNVRYI